MEKTEKCDRCGHTKRLCIVCDECGCEIKGEPYEVFRDVDSGYGDGYSDLDLQACSIEHLILLLKKED